MNIVNVPLKDRQYDICVGHKSLGDVGQAVKNLDIGSDAIVITHPVIHRLYGKVFSRSLKKNGFSVKVLTVPSGEKSKSIETAFRLLKTIAEYDVKKRLFIVAFGGGVVGDLAGFVAATYKRGIPFVQVPTTILAQLDSAIGGKVAVDLSVGKNLVGAFYQPRLVFSDIDVLSTLSKRQIRNGMGEAIKYGIIFDKNLFDYIVKHSDALLSLNPQHCVHVITVCSQIKARVVTADERETKGIRSILNFGHTIGHAIETANKYRDYHHGEAVALGMRVAASISARLGLLGKDRVARINDAISCLELPEKIKKVRLDAIMHYMQHDKKFKGKVNRFVLATGIGSVKVVENVPTPVIRQAVKRYL